MGEFGFDVIPCRDYQGNGAHQQISALAYNLVRNFQIDVLAPDARPKTSSRTNIFEFVSLKSLRFEMITAAGRLLNASGTKILRLSQSTARRKLFEKVPTHALPWWSGESCFVVKKEISDASYSKYNEYLKNAADAKIPVVSGISGTTDSILSLGRALGLNSGSDFNLLRAAALGWLVSERDHSAHEVMTASASFPEFKTKYRFSPDYYKSILPEDSRFTADVKRYFLSHGDSMPESVLKTCVD